VIQKKTTLKGMDILYKIISTSALIDFDPEIFNKAPKDTLHEILKLIDRRLDNLDVPLESKTVKTLELIQGLVSKTILSMNDTLRSRSSSLTSTGSLGDRLAVRDKEDYLYTYPWVNRDSGANGGDPNAIWERGNSFREWAEHPHRRLPSPNSALNCWEGARSSPYKTGQKHL